MRRRCAAVVSASARRRPHRAHLQVLTIHTPPPVVSARRRCRAVLQCTSILQVGSDGALLGCDGGALAVACSGAPRLVNSTARPNSWVMVAPMRDATRIFGLVLAVGIVVVGCETLTGTNTVDPPKWIHGTWEACAGEGVHRWEFGTRKAVFTDGNGRVVYSELGGAGVTVKDEASSSRYSISYANGPADAVTVIIFTAATSSSASSTSTSLAAVRSSPSGICAGAESAGRAARRPYCQHGALWS